MPDTITYEPTAGRLIIDDDLLSPLQWPQALKLERRSSALLLTTWDTALAARGDAIVCPVVYGDEDIEEPTLAITAEQAHALNLQPGDYRVWVDEERIYALPMEAPPAQAPVGQIGVTIYLLPEEQRTLEQLAIEHGVSLVDVLTAFAADLAGAHADSIDARYGGRNGGSDEREFANEWFRRNVDPTGPEFMRSFAEEAND